MSNELTDQIEALVISKLAAIAGVQMADPPAEVFDVKNSDGNVLVVRRWNNAQRWTIRGAQEFVLDLSILCVVPTSLPDPRPALGLLMGAVKETIQANRYWNDGTKNLARRTRIVDDRRHRKAARLEATTSGTVRIEIMGRQDLKDMTSTKAI